MPDYEKMYFQLAARVADAIDILISAQQQGEDEYAKEGNPVAALHKGQGEKPKPPK